MKKLLLYLMALLAFGSIPVDSFAEDNYFKPNGDGNLQIPINNGNTKEATLTNASDGVFFTVWNGSEDINWTVSNPQVNVRYQMTKGNTKANPSGWTSKKVKIEAVAKNDYYITFVQEGGGSDPVGDPELYFYESNKSSAKFSKDGNVFTYTIDATSADIYGVIVDKNVSNWDGAHATNAYFSSNSTNDIIVSGNQTWTMQKRSSGWNGCYKFEKGKKYIITLNYSNGNFSGNVKVEGGGGDDPTIDYTKFEVKFQSASYGSSWPVQPMGKLDENGVLTFTAKAVGGFNLQFCDTSDNNKGYRFSPTNSAVKINGEVNSFTGIEEGNGYYTATFDKTKDYAFTVDYKNKTLVITPGVTNLSGYKVYLHHKDVKPDNQGTVDGWNNATGVALSKNADDQWVADNNDLDPEKIGKDYFIVKVSNGSVHEYYGLPQNSTVKPGVATTLTKYASGYQNNVMTIAGAGLEDEYCFNFNYDTKTLTLTKKQVIVTSDYNLLIQYYDEANSKFEDTPSVIEPIVDNTVTANIAVGKKQFLIGYQDLVAGNIRWYRLNASKQEYALDTEIKLTLFGTSGEADDYNPTALATNKTRFKGQLVGANEDETFKVVFNYSTSNPNIKFIPDYTQTKVLYGPSVDNVKEATLNENGNYSFTYTTGDNEEEMYLWFECPHGDVKSFGTTPDDSDQDNVIDGALHLEFSDGWALGFPADGALFEIPNYPTLPDDCRAIKGLKKNTTYNINLSYPGVSSIDVTEIPVQLYLQGTFAGGSEGVNKDEWELSYDVNESKYVKRNVNLRQDDHLSIVTSTGDIWNPSNSDYDHFHMNGVPTSDENWTLKHYSDNRNNYMISKYSGQVDIFVDWNTKRIEFKAAANQTPINPEASSLTIFYGDQFDNVHTTDGANYIGGQYVTIDRGYDYRGSVKENDGLGLGYDTFYFRTLDNLGLIKYWIVDEAEHPLVVEDGLITGSPYKLKEVSEDVAKANKNTRMGENAGLVNTRYDVEYNWTNRTVTITANELWMAQPNRMYLYCLDEKENLRREYNGNEYEERTPAQILNVVKEAMSTPGKVYIYDRVADGEYQHNFSATDEGDFPTGTKFCIVGRSGQIYNIATDDKTAYQLDDAWFNSEDQSYRMELTRDADQAPAEVKTAKLDKVDAFSLIRANFTGSTTVENEDPDIYNSYVFTLEVQQPAPVKFVLKSGDETVEVPKVEGSEDNYATSTATLTKNTVYSVFAVYENGSETQFRLPVANVGNIADGSTDYFRMWNRSLSDERYSDLKVNTDEYEDYADIAIEWKNGRPLMSITPETVEKTVKVYFIDRAGWNDIAVYNYSDFGLHPVGGNEDDWGSTDTTERNGDWPGQKMTLTTLSTISSGIEMEPGTKVFEINLKVKQHADGSYVRPKLIFNNNQKEGAKQTKNLYLVDGGIYTNEGKAKDENNNEYVKYPATEYLPRMWFNYMDDLSQQTVEPWAGTAYSVIYLDVPEYVDWVDDSNGDHKLAVEIKYKKDGEIFRATGIPGKHYVYPVEISGKRLIRVAIARDILPNNITLEELSFFPMGCKTDSPTGYSNNDLNQIKEWTVLRTGQGGDNITAEDNTSYSSKAHNATKEPGLKSAHQMNVNNVQDVEVDGKHYHGNHLYCAGSLCSLNFVNVNYRDGNVYRRAYYYDEEKNLVEQPAIIQLSTLVAPDAIYLAVDNSGSVSDNVANNAVKAAVGNGLQEGRTNSNVPGKMIYPLNVTDTENPEKLIYYVDGLLPAAQFQLVARYKKTTSSGESYDYITYSCATNTALRSGYVNTFHKAENGIYSIRPVAGAQNYKLVVTWTENTVAVTANKTKADFSYGIIEGNADAPTFVKLGAIALPAHSDDCHEDHLTPLYIEYASGYDNYGNDLSRLNNLEVRIVRDTEYDKYFPAGGKNKPLEIITKDDGSIFTVEKASTSEGRGIAKMYVRGYTAGLAKIHIEQKLADDIFHRSSIDIPLRIYPTVEGIGLHINGAGVGVDENGEYKAIIPSEEYKEGKEPPAGEEDNRVNFRDKLAFQPHSATYQIGDENVLEIYWKERSTPSSAPRRRVTSVNSTNFGSGILIPEGSSHNPFATADETGVDTEMTRYSINSTPKIPIDEGNNGQYLVQFKQNGITSPMYTLNVVRGSKQDVETEVEEILDFNDAEEAVYFNLNGVKVNAENLQPGIYIRVRGDKSDKIIVR